ncbi:beta-ketoacyl synthase N-terminal-like domain-containing protein [Gilvimarinus chinensis]|uniref:beta-ketoacyl synthase N-terminal-like domain-containing protein n=1 Tax=Gilvimarinus chinensis TaxID=396005 RepID=UPI000370A20E|nr:beta-ketoacyl synthase N-terminal-like domain-containing protein [Gilvimarinus chinensis]
MSAIIRSFSARSALGENIAEAVPRLLRSETNTGSVSFSQRCEKITLPYFSAPRQADFYEELKETVQHLIEQGALNAQERKRTALLIGSSSFDVHISEQQYRQALESQGKDSAVAMPIIGYGKIAQRLGDSLGLGPVRSTYSTACTSSANALLYANRLIKQGQVDHAIVIGTEHINATSALGFYGLGLISPTGVMASFAPHRDGLILGDGCGALLLSHERHTPSEQRRWSLTGGAICTDNHSLTAAHSSGAELAKVIQAAYQNCGLRAEDIRAVKLHGTASLLNDEAEAAAMHLTFDKPPPGFVIKPYIGHTLGACGAIETALMLGCLQQGKLPINPGTPVDNKLGMNILSTPTDATPGYYLLNCFAFGGNNNALIVQDRGIN